ncbi:hypothetical protein pb186bvf_005851 [Paramecium bursaria]
MDQSEYEQLIEPLDQYESDSDQERAIRRDRKDLIVDQKMQSEKFEQFDEDPDRQQPQQKYEMNIRKKIDVKNLKRDDVGDKFIARTHTSYINRKLLVDTVQDSNVKAIIDIFSRFKREGDLSKAIDNTDILKFKDLLLYLIKAFNLISSDNSHINYIKEIFRSEQTQRLMKQFFQSQENQKHYYKEFFQGCQKLFLITSDYQIVPLKMFYQSYKEKQKSSYFVNDTDYQIENVYQIYKDGIEKQLENHSRETAKQQMKKEFHLQKGIEIDYMFCPPNPSLLEFQFDDGYSGSRFGQIFPMPDKYISPEVYLNNHFYILREDSLHNFRKGVFQVKMKRFDNCHYLENIFLYDKLEFINARATISGFIFRFYLNPLYKNWNTSKRLQAGSLIIITDQALSQLIFGIITDSYPLQIIEFKLLEGYNNLETLIYLIKSKCPLYVIENPVFYEPYLFYMRALQQAIPDQIPFQQEILNAEHPKERSSQILKSEQIQEFLDNLGTVDESQYNAIKMMMSQRLSLIQGPPGTGKTFCGAQAVKGLLQYMKWHDMDFISSQRQQYLEYFDENPLEELRNSPIIIVCYTNHALDQFLKHILKFFDKKHVIRIGGQCKDDEVSKCTIQNKVDESTKKINFNWKAFLKLRKNVEEQLNKIGLQHQGLSAERIVYNFTIQAEQICSQFLNYFNIRYQEIYVTVQYYLIALWLRIESLNEIKLKDVKIVQELIQVIKEQIGNNDKLEQELEKRYMYQLDYTDIVLYDEETIDFSLIIKLTKKYKKFDEIQKVENLRNWSNSDRTAMKSEFLMKLNSTQINWSETNCRIYLTELKEIRQLYQIRDAYILRNMKIIGLTVTGCAKYIDLLKSLNAKIMVIEEAAEVLESHCAAILNKNIEHLIMIGDHQQLRPKLESYFLESKYKTNISLFERLINNGIEYVKLTKQRRMKTDFADFVRLIYGKDYQDHEIIQAKNQTQINGIIDHLIFFDHQNLEDEESNMSKYNSFESLMIVQLVQYLIRNLYKQESITVLSFYLKQVNDIQWRLKKEGIYVTVVSVDNYQGEENDIIILSLVRSNKQNQLGFIGIDNRICVAFSRARLGFYVFGNFKFIKESVELQLNNNQKTKYSDLWLKIIDLAEKKGIIKSQIKLQCKNHSRLSQIQTIEDWLQSPLGGCLEICQQSYDCGHDCGKHCHPFDHSKKNCYHKCNQILVCGHLCKNMCSVVPCPPCYQKLYYELPKCEHFIELTCNNANEKECYRFYDEEESMIDLRCKVPVYEYQKCGHQVQKQCFDFQYPNCTQIVKNQLKCGHQIEGECHSIDRMICQQKVEIQLQCGHKIKKVCSEKEIPPCQEFVSVSLICGHMGQKSCRTGQIKLCLQQITIELSCGHTSNVECYNRFNEVKCNQKLTITLNCGHQLIFPCEYRYLYSQQVCNFICDKKLECGHNCQGQCGECFGDYHKYCEKKILIKKCGHNTSCQQQDQNCPVCYYQDNQQTLNSSLSSLYKTEYNNSILIFIINDIEQKGINQLQLDVLTLQIQNQKLVQNINSKYLQYKQFQWIQFYMNDSYISYYFGETQYEQMKQIINVCKLLQFNQNLLKEHWLPILASQNYFLNNQQASILESQLQGHKCKGLNCQSILSKVKQCGHKQDFVCGNQKIIGHPILCQDFCNKILPCGHQCKRKCHKQCKCKLNIQFNCKNGVIIEKVKCQMIDLEVQHARWIQDIKIRFCLQNNSCGHICTSQKGKCFSTIHMLCKQLVYCPHKIPKRCNYHKFDCTKCAISSHIIDREVNSSRIFVLQQLEDNYFLKDQFPLLQQLVEYGNQDAQQFRLIKTQLRLVVKLLKVQNSIYNIEESQLQRDYSRLLEILLLNDTLYTKATDEFLNQMEYLIEYIIEFI